MTDHELIVRGSEAERLLANGVLNAAFVALETAALDAVVNSQPEQAERRETAYYEARAARSVARRLNAFVADGRKASERLSGKPERLAAVA